MSLSCLIPFSSSPSQGEFQAPQHEILLLYYLQIHLLPSHRSTIYQLLASLSNQHPVYSLCIYTWSFLGLEWLFLLFLLRNASHTTVQLMCVLFDEAPLTPLPPLYLYEE